MEGQACGFHPPYKTGSAEICGGSAMSSEWKFCEIQDVCSVGDGAHSKVERTSSGVLYLTSKNIGQGVLKLDKIDYISQESFENLFPLRSKATRRPKSGDLLIGIIGTFGNAYVYKEDDSFGFSSSIGILRPDPEKLDSLFLYYVISSPKFKTLHLATDGGSAQGYTNIPSIKKLPIHLPPLQVQKEIAGVLGSLDDRIALLRETNATLEAIAQALFKSWFVDFDPVRAKQQGQLPEGMDEATAALFPDSFEESALGLVPKAWDVGVLEDLFYLQRGFDLPANDRRPGQFPIIAASGPSGTHDTAMATAPGVITGRSGVLGKVFLELEDYWPLNTALWVKEFRGASPCFAYELLRLLDLGSFNAGSAVPTLNRNHIHSLQYLIPDRKCVDAYEKIAIQLHQRARINQDQAAVLASIRDSLLPRLISGQLRLPDVNTAIEETCDVV
jgi:type I restriction enzyme, S subunit